MTNFEKWDKAFRSQNLFLFNNNENGLLWLKVRAIRRKKLLNEFIESNHIELESTTLADKTIELFELLEDNPNAMIMLNNFLKVTNHNWYNSMGIDEEQLKEDLYKMHNYSWGGDQNNSLDKHLVSRYVKVICSYDSLVEKQTEIASNAWNYVQASWYNNWTSFLIESLFKKHERVISAVGEIKSVDFFIDNNPIDLKVTFFPNQYMDEQLKQKLGKKEVSWLKDKANAIGITIDSSLSDSQKKYTLSEKISELGHNEILNELKAKRKEIITEAQANTSKLMKWLYENQGEMRFGAENRLFLILVDTEDMNQSWKMKRALSVIEPKVNEYLKNFSQHSLKKIEFSFKNKVYNCLADTIFIIKQTKVSNENSLSY